MEYPIRVLHVVQRMETCGTQAFLMNLYRNIDRKKVQFDFLVEYDNKEFYDDEIMKLGGRIYYTNFRKTLNVIKFKKTLASILDSHPEYKIIHIHATAIGRICSDVARKKHIPVIIAHTHNNGAVRDWKYYPKKILRAMYLKGPTDFFACSEEAGKYTFKNRNFRVIHNAIDVKKFTPNSSIRKDIREELSLGDNFVVGNVGRLHEQKNQLFLIDVFYELLKIKNNAILMIVGSGPLEGQLRNKIKELSIENKVIFLSSRNDMERIYQAMDVFVLPSLFEGLGIVAIEAQAAGLPVVLSDGVSKEAAVTNNVRVVSLRKTAKEWANQILSSKSIDTDIEEKIRKAGFDIKEQADWLESYYVKRYVDE